MSKIAALFYFALSLYGCDVGSASYVNRTVADGSEALYSRATVKAGVARFECVHSTSGRCHYAVYAGECGAPAGQGTRSAACHAGPLQRFALDAGDTRQVPGLTGFSLCVGTDAAGSRAGCDATRALATR